MIYNDYMSSNQKIKLVIIIDSFARGGAENVVRVLIPEFLKSFQEVHLILIQNTEIEYPLLDLENLGLKIHRLNAKKIAQISVLFNYLKLIYRIKPGVVHAHLFWSQILSAISRITFLKIKIFWIEHDTSLSRTQFNWFIYRCLSLTASKVVAVSLDVKNFLNTYKIKNIEVVHNPVLDIFTLRSDFNLKPKFLFVGRLVEQKNPILLIKSFSYAINNYMIPNNSSLVICGEGKLENSLKILVSSLKLDKSVLFLKFIEPNKLVNIYQESCILISTSLHEGFGLTRLEALATGSAVITTKTAGITGIIGTSLLVDLKNIGIFIVNDDIKSVAIAMGNALEPKIWKHNVIIQRAELINRFSPKFIASKYLMLQTSSDYLD
jgi:glycosyltransferase involved in cell wall biosynthesis